MSDVVTGTKLGEKRLNMLVTGVLGCDGREAGAPESHSGRGVRFPPRPNAQIEQGEYMEDKTNMRTIEISGTKFEVDMRTAKRIDNFRVGDKIKLLKKVYSDYKVYAGVIVGFTDFKSLPTIIICYLDVDYSGANIDFAYLNKDTKEMEIAVADAFDIPFEKNDVLSRMDKEIEKKNAELQELQTKKTFFIEHFNQYFEDFAKAAGAV